MGLIRIGINFMTQPFVAKYIHVEWSKKNKIKRIEESRDIIPIERIDESTSTIEIVTYTKLENGRAGQLAFHLTGTSNEYTPHFIPTKKDLVPIEDPDNGKIWWIEGGNWKKYGEIIYRDSPMCRHVGEAKVKFGNYFTCVITIHSLSFTNEELDLYLGDFRHDLWGLITRDDHYITASIEKESHNKFATKELINFLKRFIKITKEIVDNPKKELKETQSKQPADKVRPIPRTFMEISTKGYSKLLTGRDCKETYNVAENKYVNAILYNIYVLVKNLIILSQKKQNDIKKKLMTIIIELMNFLMLSK